MAILRERTILLISSQPWDHIPISKHNYAHELLRRGNTVYFLQPPVAGLGSEVRVQPAGDSPGLFTVTCSFPIPVWLRFHARLVYDLWMKREIGRIVKAIGRPIDVVWSFEFNLYMNLREFGGQLAIYHIVDPISLPSHVAVSRSADAVFTVSKSILSMFASQRTPSFLLGHGLPEAFVSPPLATSESNSGSREKKIVGYAGNLMHRAVNRAVVRQCVSDNPDVEFHFWGPADVAAAEGEPEQNEMVEFIRFLRDSINVRMHGRVTQGELARSMGRMDCLILSYQPVARGFDRSNSHKMLEYLSTGNVVVSSKLLEYEDHADIVRLAESSDDSDLPALLKDTLARLDEFNSEDLRRKRRDFALQHTYARQVDTIEERLASIVTKG